MTAARKLMRDAPEMLTDLFDTASAAARRAGLNDEEADTMALEIIDTLTEAWAGQQLYFGKGARMRLRQRDLAIYQDFTGDNHAELAAKYKVSKVWVYAVLRRVNYEINSETQQSLL